MTDDPSRSRLLVAWLGVAVSAAGVAASVTVVYLAMRDTMATAGGFCARGGPYEIASECDSGTFGLLFGGIVAFLAFTALHVAFSTWARGPQVGLFAILGALFLALGWNFVDFGLDPPGASERGIVFGWLLPGVVFWLIGIAFLAPAAMRARDWLGRGGAPEPAPFSPALVQSVFAPAIPAPPASPPGPSAPPAPRPRPVAPTRLVPPGPPDRRPPR
ncbi:MAG TPA: hypothetical protein VF152_05075 [Acidimicrobiia bacterium]